MSTLPYRYVLVSACRDEAHFITGLVETIRAQTLAPLAWVIVDDGSADETRCLATTLTQDVTFASALHLDGQGGRSFASQVYAARHGYEAIRHQAFDFVGFLDADIRLPPSYYESVIRRFHDDDSLGLAGGAVLDCEGDRATYQRGGSEDHHVPGGIQFFRRACFEAIGGYRAVEGGGQDTIADLMVMMQGWKVRVFADLEVLHLRPEGAGGGQAFARGLAAGHKYYNLAYDVFYLVAHCVRRSRSNVVASMGTLLGFLRATWHANPRPVSADFIVFQRQLQRQRLKNAFFRLRRNRGERATGMVRARES